MRVGVDLDGVGYAWDKTARFLLKWHKGYDLPPSQTWDSIQEAVSPEDWKWLWSEAVVNHGLYRHGHLLKGFKEAMDTLDTRHDVVILTARPSKARQDTLEWLAYHRIPTREVHILGKEPKSTVKCDVYIDDGPHNLRDLAHNVPEARLISWDRPYNDYNGECRMEGEAIRTNDWRTALEFIG